MIAKPDLLAAAKAVDSVTGSGFVALVEPLGGNYFDAKLLQDLVCLEASDDARLVAIALLKGFSLNPSLCPWAHDDLVLGFVLQDSWELHDKTEAGSWNWVGLPARETFNELWTRKELWSPLEKRDDCLSWGNLVCFAKLADEATLASGTRLEDEFRSLSVDGLPKVVAVEYAAAIKTPELSLEIKQARQVALGLFEFVCLHPGKIHFLLGHQAKAWAEALAWKWSEQDMVWVLETLSDKNMVEQMASLLKLGS